jgi:hypothetical protein
MARKKARRTNISQEALSRARREMGIVNGQPEAPGPSPAPRSSASAVQKTTIQDLAAEYAYVLTDLRNMGILAAVLFALLLVLSFLL